MHIKKLVGVVAVVAVTVFGAEAGAEPAAPTPAQKKAAPVETLTLKPGELHSLEVKDMTRVAVGDPEIANIAVEGKGATVLHITGGKPGETTLLVWTKDGARREYKLVVQG